MKTNRPQLGLAALGATTAILCSPTTSAQTAPKERIAVVIDKACRKED